MDKEINKVFKIRWDKKIILYPPKQVFDKNDFNFLLTKGGNLADNEIEYKKLMDILKIIGEKEFFIVENIGVAESSKLVPFIGKLSTESNFDSFQRMGRAFNPNFGWTTSHFFVYGNSDDWGIYICEYPSINIIGCNKKYVNAFKEVFGIKGDGFKELDEFISKEFNNRPELKRQLIENYNLQE